MGLGLLVMVSLCVQKDVKEERLLFLSLDMVSELALHLEEDPIDVHEVCYEVNY